MTNPTPFNPSASVTIKKIFLEKLRFASRRSVAASVLEHAELYDMIDAATGDMILALESYVLAETLENYTRTVKLEAAFDYPATWWQMFKRDYFPSWLLARYPVVYKTERQTKQSTVTFKKYATYPQTTITTKELGTPVYRTYVEEKEV